MLPLVLGGIALAAVGYGVKELCEEEGFPWDEPYDARNFGTEKNSCAEDLYEIKLQFYEALHLAYFPVVGQLEGYMSKPLKYPYASFKKENYPKDSEEVEMLACKAADTFGAATVALTNHSKKLENIMITKKAYSDFSVEEKALLESADGIARGVSKLCHKMMFNKEGNICSKYVKRFIRSE
jgi:hypothetical protein